MSSRNLVEAMSMDVSDRQFRIVVHLADQMGEGWSAVEVAHLADLCRLRADIVRSEIRQLIEEHPACGRLSLNSPETRCPGPDRIEGQFGTE